MKDLLGKVKELVVDFVSGTIAGVLMVATSHPFEYQKQYTVKTRLQIDPGKGTFTCIRDIVQKEGFFSLYKGMLTPISYGFPVSAVTFSTYEGYMKFMEIENRKEMIYKHWIIGGCLAGVAQSVIICPGELLKTVLQMQTTGPKRFKGPTSVFIHLIKENKNPFKGYVATLFRDVPQYAGYLCCYELYKHYHTKITDKKELSLIHGLFAGVLSGLGALVVSYPQDVIKTNIQSEILKPNSQKRFQAHMMDGGVSACIRYIYRQKGMKGFFSGMSSCALDYSIHAAAQIATYDQCKQILNRYAHKYLY